MSKSIFLEVQTSLNLFKKDAITSWHQKLDDKAASWIRSFVGPKSVLYKEQVAYLCVFVLGRLPRVLSFCLLRPKVFEGVFGPAFEESIDTNT